MDNITNNHLLIIGGLLAIIAEVIIGAATGFDLLLAGIIFMIAGGIGLYLGSFSLAILSVGVLSFLYIILGRNFIKSKLAISTHPMNVDNLVHKKARVIKAIDPNKPGQIKVEGEIWRAEADTHLAPGEEVEIISISGVTVRVQLAS